ncbi:MAG TPA: MFS transporter [Actinomycetota bacterium]|nr:MFS transporter [Actinomycetota bacterium]
MIGPATAGRSTRQRIREVFTSSGFRRLVVTRVTSQIGDGLFQLAAADLLLFDDPGANPALKLTALVAVTLIPFSVVVPFVGVFIDRWDRRKILTYTPLGRAGLAALLPFTIFGTSESPVFFVIALVVLSANRLFLATMSAVLPSMVPKEDLLVANSVAATGGSIATVTGLGIGAATSAAFGGTRAALVAAVAFAVAGVLARRLPIAPHAPRLHDRLWSEVRVVLEDMVAGVRRIAQSRRVPFALTAVGAGQFFVGTTTGATTVIFISQLGLGIGSVATLLAAVGIGLGVGVVLVPLVARRIREDFIVPISFAIGSSGVLLASTSLSRGRLTAAAGIVGLSYAFAKIPVDTIVQEEMPDGFRGRAFAVYDMLFNIARVAGTGAAALAVEAGAPLDGVMIASSLGYLGTSGALFAWARRIVDVRKRKRSSDVRPAAGFTLPAGEMVTVRAYAGSRADEEPRAIVVAGDEVPIEEIEWRAVVERSGERRRVFVVRVGGKRVRLAHVEPSSLWEVERVMADPDEARDERPT